MNLKKLILLILLIVIIVLLVIAIVSKTSENNLESNNKLKVVVTAFSSYDFVRQIAGDKVNLTLLLKPGIDAHSYEPTAQDLITIQNADLFIYIGESMEKWVDKVLSSLEIGNTKMFRLADMINLQEEQEVDGAEGHEEEKAEAIEYDEHIWTSPANSILLVQELAKLFSNEDKENETTYIENANKYVGKIEELQNDIKEIVDNKVRNRLVFGDKMPMQYFLNEFNLTSSAAFNGCSTETEPSTSTIAYLINKVKEENIPVILYIELSSGKVAKAIAEETGARPVQIYTLHNVSKTDFENGETYVSLMNKNLNVLKEALQ